MASAVTVAAAMSFVGAVTVVIASTVAMVASPLTAGDAPGGVEPLLN